ncbi:hypothetical protein AAFF_G00146400 [Aldrovandia affinis]|uniref:Uncharacterized protein n=1 Tax=Aldrovandia affinis TaxID=143900 RepID=A0AAD7RPV4_9TELE|nr:hypothetical protein AAFF_G00146400 [Aldrovandia affinis]
MRGRDLSHISPAQSDNGGQQQHAYGIITPRSSESGSAAGLIDFCIQKRHGTRVRHPWAFVASPWHAKERSENLRSLAQAFPPTTARVRSRTCTHKDRRNQAR